ncbi:MAG TPA: HAD family phosphatase [Candidatus Sulfotelmatobacter sp.]|nr:HAD family phosphatase [Candidatus Sulfotelmatobacter sp.]
MSTIRALFWDVGGVLLTNAWDHIQRAQALKHFQIEDDEEEFHNRHEMVVSSFERGKITLDEYLDRTVFFHPRPFTREAFRDYMFSLSQPLPDVVRFAQSLSNKYFMGTINNESRELNYYRIEKFGLRKVFRLFISSCFVGLRKPESGIYRLALEVTQIPAEECCFIDDRALNLECAAKLGMNTIEMDSLDQLRANLQKLGVGP